MSNAGARQGPTRRKVWHVMGNDWAHKQTLRLSSHKPPKAPLLEPKVVFSSQDAFGGRPVAWRDRHWRPAQLTGTCATAGEPSVVRFDCTFKR
jgi:hypothetical protein